MTDYTSDIQKSIFDFIVEYIREEGMPPTNREIGGAMKIASTGHVDYHLSVLEKQGLIDRSSKKSRGIKLKVNPFGVPVMGSIAAGEPIEIFSDPVEPLEVGREFDQPGSYALVVKGQSMIEDHICDKDYVVIKPQSTCENGDIVVAVHMQEGSGRAMLKRFYRESDHNRVRLQPANSEMDPIYIPRKEWDNEWQVQGKVTAVLRKVVATQNEKVFALLGVLNEGAIADKVENDGKSQNARTSAFNQYTELLKSKLTDKSDKQTLIDDYLEHPESAREELRQEMERLNIDQDEEILDAAKEVAQTIHEYKVKEQSSHPLQGNIAYERVVSATQNADGQLNQIVEQCRNEAKRWSQYSFGAATLGFLVFMGGVVLAIIKENVSLGFLTALASIIPNVAALLFFQQREKTNGRLDNFYRELLKIAKIYKATETCFSASKEAQDQHLGLIIKKWLE